MIMMFLMLLVCGAIQSVYAQPTVTLSPCHIRKVERELQCGTLEVYENREAGSGRKIPLNIVVIPATGKAPAPDPLFWFSGGPGEAATNELELILHDWPDINARRDIVLVDVRGTGKSNGLPCVEEVPQKKIQELLDSFFPISDVSNCRKDLESRADLRMYHTSYAVDDLDDVRAALGYGKINIAGGSYGTRVVLVYLRRHPENVRTATLWDVAPTGARMPLMFARDAQKAFDGLVASCKRDPQCKESFPDTTSELRQLLATLESRPAKVVAVNASTKENVEFTLSRDGLAQTVRYMLYSPATAALIPLQIHLAALGNYGPIAQSAHDYASTISGIIYDGYYLGVTCHEDVPFYTEAEAETQARDTFIGTLRARMQKDACARWPSEPADKQFLLPVRADVPALLIGGDLDPVTPPRNIIEVSRALPRSRTVLVRGGSHDFEGMANSHCIDRVIGSFLEAGNEKMIETACLATMKPAPFVLKQP